MFSQSTESQVLISFIEVGELFEINFAIYNDKQDMSFFVVDKIGEDKIPKMFLHYYKHLQAIFPNVQSLFAVKRLDKNYEFFQFTNEITRVQ